AAGAPGRRTGGGLAAGPAPAGARGQHETEMVDALGNAAIVEQAYPDDEPHHWSAGSFRRRTDAVPVTANASAIHRGSIAALNCAKLAGRSPAPAARMASPTSIAPPPVGETSYYLVDKGSRTRPLTR